jgi:uncharacterized protein (DUF1015 family)
MPRFEPFPGLRYDTERVDLADVTSPPYDVIDAAERAQLAARSPVNAVHVDLPVDEGEGDPYEVAAQRLARWRDDGVLVEDPPSFYLYRMSFSDDAGAPRQTIGVIGALELQEPGTGDVLPHEQTTPKAKSDRLNLLRATAANLSAVWCLSLTEGLTKLLDPPGPPLGEWTDRDGVHHELWRVDDAATVQAIADAVGSSPVVIADGHHRYETSLAYRRERASGGATDLTLAYIVELVDDQLTVRPIHRLIAGLPDGFELVAALEPFFSISPADPTPHADGLMLVQPAGAHLLVPRPEALAGARDLDSSRLDVALASFPPHELTFQHGVDNVTRAVGDGRAQAGVLLRPATVDQIARTAHDRDRMPPKTTFFHPKVKTGLVFRSLA